MKIVENKVTDYLSINVTEDETLWSDTALYDYYDEVRYGNYIYRYAGEDNTNTEENPEFIWNRDKDAYSVWVLITATNYFAALDDKTKTQTTNADELIIEIENNDFDNVGLLNVTATDVMIELIDLSTMLVIQNFSYDMQNNENIVDEKTYWYEPFDLNTEVYEPNITLFPNTKIKITITNIGGIAALGRLVAGRSFFLGDTIYPATVDQITYSRFDTNIFGDTDLVQGNSARQVQYNIIAPLTKIRYLERKRKEWTAIPVLFIANENDNSGVGFLLVYGYFTSAPFNISNGSRMTIPINIKGLI